MLKPSLIQHNFETYSQNVFDKTALLILRGGDSQLPPVIPPSKFEPFIEKFTPGHEQHANIAAAIILATLLKPTAKVYFEQLSTMMRSRISKITKQHEGDRGIETIETFEMSKFHQVVKTIVEAARLYLAVAVFDVCKTIISCIGIKLPKGDVLTVIFGWGIYLMWGFRRLSGLKFYFLKNIMINTAIIDDPRRLHFINRISDYGLMLFGFFLFYEILNFELGYGGKTILTTLSFGTAAVALATKDIITNFLNGIILSASDRIYEGDFISIQGDIKKVNRLGWLETRLRSSDNKLYTVSNTELVSTKLSNLSRINTCQVCQKLGFPFNAVGIIPKLCLDIKSEIRAACPSVITDGSFPFRCYWVNFGKNHLEVFVNVHFRIPPVGDAYYENQQQCLLAIDRAIRKNGIEDFIGGT